MVTMRKPLALLSLLVLVITLAACGDNTITPVNSGNTAGITDVATTTGNATSAATVAGSATTFQGKYFTVSVPNGWVMEDTSQIIPSFQIPNPNSLETVGFNNPTIQTQYTVRYLSNSYASLKDTFNRQPKTKTGSIQAGSLMGIYSISVGKHPMITIKTPFTIGQCLLPVAGDTGHTYDIEYQEPLGNQSQIDQHAALFQQFCQSLVPVTTSN